MALVAIGKVVRAVGLSGFVGVSGSEGALGRLAEVTLRREGAPPRTCRVRLARPQGRLWAVQLEGITDREAAEEVIGSVVLAEREALGEAGEDEHFWGDLKGLPVYTEVGEALGKVTGLLATGAVDVLVVEGGRGELLVPLAPYVRVDRAGGKVVVDPPEGLLDLAAGDETEKGGPERGS